MSRNDVHGDSAVIHDGVELTEGVVGQTRESQARDPADVHPDSKDYDFFVKEFSADVTASRLIEAWRTQAPAYPPPAFIADTQMADYLVLEQASPTDGSQSRTVSPLRSFGSEGYDSG
ncbi:uncharacterized protein FIBRA_07331 [Fibroporia radiculosa]|uniref:Uncharacterized protein n=1 Tax=Fibroporia radiculosa TaxID=599839 RepID=J4GE50_9APHY|nr:uncharacterized protein FIBRA_07331 [Fibroporia radiculosa]CCM05123.1 predicted protein [Fibroporia radiculosa]